MTLQEVADELGVHYMTAYRYVRLGMLVATKRGRSWEVTRDDLDAFIAGQSVPSPDRGATPWDERFLNRILAPDDAGAWAVIEAALAAGMTPPDVYMKVITPALRRIGDLWSGGELSIAQEHAASQVTTRVVARLAPRMVGRGVRRGTVVIGSTATEMHNLPISIVADLFRSRRFTVLDLGGNLPPEEFAAAVAAADDVVVAAIGITAPNQHAEIARTIAALREATDVPIMVGGSGISRNDALALGADVAAATGEEALEALETIAGSR
jgi:excisionase family DNA binding protein